MHTSPAHTPAAPRLLDLGALTDAELVGLAMQRRPEAFRIIIQRHNRRLYRLARAILRDGAEAEDVVQETYVRAFAGLEGFRGEATLATWLTRIALNEALGRRRRQRTTVDLATIDSAEERDRVQVIPFPFAKAASDPEKAAAMQDVRRVLERAIDALPDPFRVVLVMRDVEEMSVEETARQLSLRPQTVRTRLHRARKQLREAVRNELESALTDAFPFAGRRCASLADAVLRRLGIPQDASLEEAVNPQPEKPS